MMFSSIHALLDQYFTLLDEQRAWKNRSPFPKRAELQEAEQSLRIRRDVRSTVAEIPDLALCNSCGLVNLRRSECLNCGNHVGESSKAATASQIDAWIQRHEQVKESSK